MAMTAGQDRLMWDAMRALAGHCDGAIARDGVGFNGTDSRWGREIAQVAFERWSPRVRWIVRHKILPKYRNQLLGYGIDLDQIPAQPNPSTLPNEGRGVSGAAARRVTLADDRNAAITFPYDPQLVVAIKEYFSFHMRRWNPERKQWEISLSEAGVRQLESWLERYPDFKVEPDLALRIAELKDEWEAEARAREEEKAREAATRAEREAESRAVETDFRVDGLGGTPRPYQWAGAAFAYKYKRVLLGHEMGLGKTVMAIIAAQKVRQDIEAAGGVFTGVVICPASLKVNWQREIQKWAPGSVVRAVGGTKPFEYDRGDVDWIVINYDVTHAWSETLHSFSPNVVIVDESDYIKSPKARRTKATQAICEDAEYRFLLTGTPIRNRAVELWEQFKAMGRHAEFGSWKRFATRYAAAYVGRFGWEYGTPEQSRLIELHNEMRAKGMYVRLEKADVLTELPAKQRAMVTVELTNRRTYDRAERDFLSFLREMEGSEAVLRASRAEHLVQIERLRQLSADGKLRAAIEWITDFLSSGKKLIVFAGHRSVQQRLLAEFPDAAQVLGDTTDRQAQVDRFQTDDGCRLIICAPKAAGAGITLTAASDVLFVEESEWTPRDYDQCEDRAHRIGQTDSVTCWYLVGENTVDERIVRLIDKKRTITDAVIKGIESDVSGDTDQSIFWDLVLEMVEAGACRPAA